ncbi:MAG: DUF4405 domain-containing protein [Archaeoglobus sp.]|nr:DUF4405 domain-containing protein [Archaeoglobus sp.]
MLSRLKTRFLIFWIMVASGLVTLISGLILWFAPRGAHSREAILYGLQKSTWLDIHPYFALLAVGMVAIHLVDKWRCLKVYLRSPLRKESLSQVKEIKCEIQM